MHMELNSLRRLLKYDNITSRKIVIELPADNRPYNPLFSTIRKVRDKNILKGVCRARDKRVGSGGYVPS